MDCKKIESEIPGYLAGELDGGRAEVVTRHLASCLACQAAVEEARAAETAIRELFAASQSRLVVPPGASPRLERKRAQGAGLRRRTGPRLALGAAALLLALLALAITFPSIPAQAAALLGRWFQIDIAGSGTQVRIEGFTAFTPWAPAWLPSGFDLTTTGIHLAPDADELELIFDRGDRRIVLVERKEKVPGALPEGIEITWGEVKAVYQDTGAAIPAGRGALFPTGPVRQLAWEQAGLRFELYSNLSREEMIQAAESVKAGRGSK